MNGSAIENSCITKYVYRVLNKIINQCWYNAACQLATDSDMLTLCSPLI